MSWDVSKKPAKIRLWEGLVLAGLPALIGVVSLGQYIGASGYLIGFFFLFIPIDFVVCVIAFDEIRRRNNS